MAKEHALATVDGVEVGVPAAQRACFAEGNCRNFRQFGGEFLGAVEKHKKIPELTVSSFLSHSHLYSSNETLKIFQKPYRLLKHPLKNCSK